MFSPSILWCNLLGDKSSSIKRERERAKNGNQMHHNLDMLVYFWLPNEEIWQNLCRRKKASNSAYKKLPKSGKFSPLPSYWRNFYHHAKFDLKSMNDRQWWPKWILYLKFSGFEALNFEVASGITYASSNMMRIICFRVEKRLVILPSYLTLTSTLLSGNVETFVRVVMITSI